MSLLDGAARQIAGATAMAAGRENWKTSLDRSIDAVFSSFGAFVLSAPFVVLFTWSAKRAATRVPDLTGTLYEIAPLELLIVGDLTVYALDWVASLALLLTIARLTGGAGRAAEIIVGYNWIQPLVAAVQLPPVAIMASTASAGAGGVAGLPSFAITIYLIWGIIRRGLGAKAPAATAILVMLIIVGGVIEFFGSAAMRALAGP